MHIPSSQNRSEFLATPSLVRFDYCDGEPILLIKGSTLLLKYIVSGARMQLIFSPIKDNHLLYAVKVSDDQSSPSILWSVLKSENEMIAIRALAKNKKFSVYLFNDLALNVAWAIAEIDVSSKALNDVTKNIEINLDVETTETEEIVRKLEDAHSKQSDRSTCIIDMSYNSKWAEINSIYISNQGAPSAISIFNKDEGGQQEELAIWLLDNLIPKGAVHSPQILKGNTSKELIDLLLSHDFGTILFESKTLSIFCNDSLPSLEKLKKKIFEHLDKAQKQLTGAITKLRNNVPIKNKVGDLVEVNREEVMHAIILVPDLDLLNNRDDLGRDMLRDFYKKNKATLHIMDMAELLRFVQAAGIISSQNNVTPMVAFDYYLMKRFEYAVEIDRICFEMIARFKQ